MADGIRPAYTATARVLHWLTAILVLTLIPVGIIMVRIKEGPAQDLLFNTHKAVGAILIPIVIIRLIYRFTHRPLPLPPEIPKLQRGAAHAIHWTLYLILIVQPFVGWIANSAYGAPL